jgi:hypothetical protein
MALYLISYDLNKPEKDYPKLIDYLEKIRAHRVLYSEWFVRSDLGRDALHEKVKAHIDGNDSLLTCLVESAVGNHCKCDLAKI